MNLRLWAIVVGVSWVTISTDVPSARCEGQTPRNVWHPGGPVSTLALGPQGKMIWFSMWDRASSGYRLHSIDTSGSSDSPRVIESVPPVVSLFSIAVSPTGRRVACCCFEKSPNGGFQNVVRFVNTESAEQEASYRLSKVTVPFNRSGFPFQSVWENEASLLVYDHSDSSLHRVDASGEQGSRMARLDEMTSKTEEIGYVSDIVTFPNGDIGLSYVNQLIVENKAERLHDGKVLRFALVRLDSSGSQIRDVIQKERRVGHASGVWPIFALSPSLGCLGHSQAFASRQPELQLADPASLTEVRKLSIPPSTADGSHTQTNREHLVISRDGRSIAFLERALDESKEARQADADLSELTPLEFVRRQGETLSRRLKHPNGTIVVANTLDSDAIPPRR
ncbi:MAG: hypothetical protein AAGD07_20125 [Planctomycetota bacterium]